MQGMLTDDTAHQMQEKLFKQHTDFKKAIKSAEKVKSFVACPSVKLSTQGKELSETLSGQLEEAHKHADDLAFAAKFKKDPSLAHT